ncbi:MAG: hypothetical protein ACXAC2_08535 [Candidatus Kariarchaeaceae archaeon]
MEEKLETDNQITLPEDIEIGKTDLPESRQSADNMFNDIVLSIKSVGNNIVDKHHKGMLPIQLLGAVAVYNFVFFQAQAGKEIYVLIPLLAALICYLFKYWEFPSKVKYYLSGGSLLFGLSWDLIVSISFVPRYDGRYGYNIDAIPTLLADFFGLLSAIVWFTNEKKFIRDNIVQQSSVGEI